MPDSRTLAVLFLVMAAIPAVAGQGTPLSGWLDSTGPATIQGTGPLALKAVQATSSQVGPADEYSLTCLTGSLVLWNYPVQELRVMRDGEPEFRDVRALQPERVATRPIDNETVTALPSEGAYSAWAFDSVQLPELGTRDILETAGPQQGPYTSFSNPLYHVQEVDGVELRPAEFSIWTAIQSSQPIVFPGAFQGALFGHALEVHPSSESMDWPVGRILNETRTTVDPASESGRIVWDTWIVHIACMNARSAFNGSPPVQFLATGINGRIDGDFVWRGVEARAEIARLPFDEENHILQALGYLSFQADLREDKVHWQVNGTIDALVADTVPVNLPPTAVVGSAAAFLIALGLFWESIRGALTFVLGRATPTLVKANVFGNDTRRGIIRALQEAPVATVGDLMEATAKSRASVRYNLRILTAHAVLQAHRSSILPKLEVYSLNSDSLRVSLTGEEPPTAAANEKVVLAEALAVIFTNEIRQSIFQFLEENPGRNRREIGDHLTTTLERQIPSSTLHDHIQLLLESGAVTRCPTRSREAFKARFTIQTVQEEQLKRFLEATGMMDALRQAISPETIHKRRRPRAKPLRRLEAMGLVETAPGGHYRAPAVLRARLERIVRGVTNAG